MERTSTWISSNTPAIGRDRIHWFMLFEVPYNLTSNTSRKEASMASLDNCAIITLWIKKLFLASHLNITSFTVKHYPISYHYSPCQRANFAHQCQTGLRLCLSLVMPQRFLFWTFQHSREPWLSLISPPLTETAVSSANTEIIFIYSCKYIGRKLNQNPSTVTCQRRNNYMTVCCNDYPCQVGQL